VFGWGSPTTIMVPLADFLNHSNYNSVQLNTLDKDLHKAMNKIYLYNHNFDKTVQTKYSDAEIYELDTSKLKLNCSRLFKEDTDVPQEVIDSWKYKEPEREEGWKKYSRELCFERYCYNKDKNRYPHPEDRGHKVTERDYKIDEEDFGQ